jgi:hypothetical protein
MGQLTKEEIQSEAQARRDRILAFMQQDPPVPLTIICQIEGMAERACRAIVKDLEAEHGIEYMNISSKASKDAMPYGLTASTARLRQKLGDNLYALRERGNDSSHFGRNQVAPQVGLNNRAQLKAESRPFAYDWKLSEIERLARCHGRDPMEFLLSCLTT